MHPIKTKADTAYALICFIKSLKKKSAHTVKKILTDGGKEFLRALDIFNSQDVQVSVPTPYTPQSNGLVEPMNPTLLSSTRSCLHPVIIPTQFWNCPVQHVPQCLHFVRHSKDVLSHFEALLNRPSPNIFRIPRFGC